MVHPPTSRPLIRQTLSRLKTSQCSSTNPGLACCGAWAMLAFGLSLAVGCMHPTAHPNALDPQAVEHALQSPSVESIRIEASQLHHPLLPPLAIDGREGYTPEEIAVMTVVVSPQLRTLRDQRGLARAQLLQAGILPNPQLSYSLDAPSGNNDPTLITGRSLGLSWDFTALLTRADRQAEAQATGSALDLDIAWQEWQAAQGARLSAYRIIMLRQNLPWLRGVEQDRAETLAAIKQAVASGSLTAMELSTATDLWLTAQNDRLAAEQELRTENASLDLSLGLPAGTDLALRTGADLSAETAALTPDELLPGLESRRLDLVALTLGYASNEAGLRAAIKGRFPKIGLSVGQANDTSNVRTRTLGVVIDLPLFDRNQAAIATSEATRQQLFDDYVARVAEARAQVPLLCANLAAARRQLATARTALPEWEHLSAAYAHALVSHHVDLTTASEAHALLTSRRLEVATLEQQALELQVALELATGRPFLNRLP